MLTTLTICDFLLVIGFAAAITFTWKTIDFIFDAVKWSIRKRKVAKVVKSIDQSLADELKKNESAVKSRLQTPSKNY